MPDTTLEQLLQTLHQKPTGQTLWIADESHSSTLPTLQPFAEQVQIHTNRFDIHQQALRLDLKSTYNDWVFDYQQPFERIALRVCKEKEINLHILKSSQSFLSSTGEMIMIGEKNDGIKSFYKSAQSYFSHTTSLKKSGNRYQAVVSQKTNLPTDNPYHQYSIIAQINNIDIYSKPGIYGWKKIDRGSELLIEQFRQHTKDWSAVQLGTFLDLGCGYGFITFALANCAFSARYATDNNAAAVDACCHTAASSGVAVHTFASDCADTLHDKVDTILCNPPFHSGFDINSDLTDRFLRAAQTNLKPTGHAFFVVNSFIGIEEKAKKYFPSITTLCNNKQFKVLLLSKK